MPRRRNSARLLVREHVNTLINISVNTFIRLFLAPVYLFEIKSQHRLGCRRSTPLLPLSGHQMVPEGGVQRRHFPFSATRWCQRPASEENEMRGLEILETHKASIISRPREE